MQLSCGGRRTAADQREAGCRRPASDCKNQCRPSVEDNPWARAAATGQRYPVRDCWPVSVSASALRGQRNADHELVQRTAACKLAEPCVLRSRGTPPVSRYTLFEGWLLLSLPPGFFAPPSLHAPSSRCRDEGTLPLVLRVCSAGQGTQARPHAQDPRPANPTHDPILLKPSLNGQASTMLIYDKLYRSMQHRECRHASPISRSVSRAV